MPGPAVRHARALNAGSNGPAWDLLQMSAAVLIVTAVARLHLVFPAISAARPVLISGAAATALLLLDRHPARNLVALDSTLTRVLVAFLLWMAVTVPFALHDGRSFLFLFDTFAKTVLIYFVLVGTVRGLVDVNRLALSYFAGAVTYALVVLVRFEVGNESWRLTNLYTYDPNDFATFAVTALPLGVYFTQGRNRPTLRFAAATGCVALVAAFVWAGSRGGFLALLGMLAVLLLHYHAISATRRLLAGGLMVGAMLLVATDRYWSQMSSILDTTQDYNLTSETGRMNVWKRGLGYVLERPVFGVGPSNFPMAEGVLSPLADRQQYGLGVRWTAPHNSFLQVASELGLPGLIIFLALFVCTFRVLGRVARGAAGGFDDHPEPRSLAQALTASVAGFVIGAIFLSLAYLPMLYALMAMAAALAKVTRSQARHGPTVGRRNVPPWSRGKTPGVKAHEEASPSPRSEVWGMRA